MSDTANTLFPVLDPATEAALRASIERFGVLVPVVVDQDGQLLDGNNRWRIAEELGVECPTLTYQIADDEERAEIMRTLNCDRRQMSPEQRRQAAIDLKELGHSNYAIAGALNVNEITVRRDLSGATYVAPESIHGRDGKTYPAKQVQPGDLVEDDNGEVHEVHEVEEWGDELVFHDEHGDALTVGPEKEVRRLTKPDLGGGVSHPARFSQELLPIFAELLEGFPRVLDPFAGTGRIHELEGHDTVGVEIEPEWADLHQRTIVGNALKLGFRDGEFDAICTSPTYGNRLADHHEASDASLRRSYTHDLGHQLHEDNSGSMQWGDGYRTFHELAWSEAVRVLRPGGRFLLNISDHIRDGAWQDVSAWHARTLMELGLGFVTVRPVVTRRLLQGENADLRVNAELVWVFAR